MNEEQLYAAVRQLPSTAERLDYLDRYCQNQEMRARLEARLNNESGATFDFLASAAPAQPEQDLTISLLPDTFSGLSCAAVPKGLLLADRYQLLEKLAEGGMGEVWVAKQEQPVKRLVAVKLIKGGIHSQGLLARFDQERQTLAMMEHPNIAMVLDAGVIEETPAAQDQSASQDADSSAAFLSGTKIPFFVMELVQGLPLLKFCDQEKLDLRQRLELFLPICEAVQHAHQKGIIHRDLKPSNILVSRLDGAPHPKVIDFGVAKIAVDSSARGDWLATQAGTIIGTPEYMAPEQAAYGELDIDTRADVYSLGVVLYELLTGLRPFDSARLQDLPYDERLRILRTEDPPRPSVRVTQAKTGAALPASLRGTDPKHLAQFLAGDLDWIVMKCLEKDRTRRYDSASMLARDLQRYLHDEAVEASPPSAGYRLRKFYRRNRAMVLVASIAILALLAGIIGTTWGWVLALHERDDKEAARTVAVAAEKTAREAAEQERQARELADRRLTQVEKANEVLASVFRDLNPFMEERGGPNLRMQLGEQLSKAARLLDDADPVTTARLKSLVGQALRNLEQRTEAIAVLKEALELRTNLLGADHVDTLETKAQLAQTLVDAGELAPAIDLLELAADGLAAKLGTSHRLTLRTRGRLAWALMLAGKTNRGCEILEEIVQLQEEALGRDHEDTLISKNQLATTLSQLNRNTEAIRVLSEVHEQTARLKGMNHYQTLTAATNLALAFYSANELDKAISRYEETLPRWHQLVGPDHMTSLICAIGLAESYRRTGKLERALELLDPCVAKMRERAGEDHPRTLNAENNLALIYEDLERFDEALALYAQTLARMKAKQGPSHPETVNSHLNYANCLRRAGRLEDAIRENRAVLAAAQQNDPEGPDALECMFSLGTSLMDADLPAAAEGVYRDALALAEKTSAGSFGALRLRALLGHAQLKQKKLAEAELNIRSACESMKPRARPGSPNSVYRLSLQWLIECYELAEKTEDAEVWRRELEAVTRLETSVVPSDRD